MDNPSDLLMKRFIVPWLLLSGTIAGAIILALAQQGRAPTTDELLIWLCTSIVVGIPFLVAWLLRKASIKKSATIKVVALIALFLLLCFVGWFMSR